jgi:two-component system chemotaxis response regulator CheB
MGVKNKNNQKTDTKYSKKSIIAIGASMGGVDAIRNILIKLPTGLPGIVVTQHMPPVFTEKYAQRLDKECSIKIVEGKDGEEVLSGYAYLAPGGLQMGIKWENNRYILDIKQGDKVSGHCPSVDYLFESVALHAKENAVAVILTGMGSDGAKGLLSIKNSGGYTIGQDKETCLIYGMPMAAKNIGAIINEVPLDEIPNLIMDKIKRI